MKYLAALFLLAASLLAAAPAAAQEVPDVWTVAEEAFPADQVAFAVRVARCESGHNPWATAEGYDSYYGYYRYVGLWQVDPNLHGYRAVRMFGPDASLYDPRVNAHVAAEILRVQGWGAWPYCSRRAW